MSHCKDPYSKDELETAVQSSTTATEALQKLNRSVNGGAFWTFRKRLKEWNVSTIHFCGRAANCGDKHKGGPKKLTWQEILVHGQKHQQAYRLRWALLASGREEKCECGISNEWNGKPYKLQIHHRDGNKCNNLLENLTFICHNCHSQTSNFGFKGYVVNRELADRADLESASLGGSSPSVPTIYSAPVAQPVEASDLKSEKCQFESD
jgi:hypothetical protein